MMRMSYHGAASAMKMPLCAAMAAMGTSTASAVFGKSHSSSWSQVMWAAFVCSSHWAEKQAGGEKI